MPPGPRCIEFCSPFDATGGGEGEEFVETLELGDELVDTPELEDKLVETPELGEDDEDNCCFTGTPVSRFSDGEDDDDTPELGEDAGLVFTSACCLLKF